MSCQHSTYLLIARVDIYQYEYEKITYICIVQSCRNPLYPLYSQLNKIRKMNMTFRTSLLSLSCGHYSSL